MAKRQKGEHYVDNKVFLQAMIEWKEKCALSEEAGEEKPPVTNYIGECFLKIATHLSYRPNFINYTYKDEMVSDGIENCLQYASNFNPEKSKNPFAYFTQIIYYAFLRRIQKEKKQTHVKNKIVQETDHQSWTTMTYDERSYNIPYSFAIENLPQEDVYKPKNTTVDEKKKSKKKDGLERFMDDDIDDIAERGVER
jgi:DNA-directed RNA polymerase specialized sigma24 family protein